MEISVIVVTFNSSRFIAPCLRSILERLTGIEHELIVVDNASVDDTCHLIEREFPQVYLLPNSSNEGFAKANNLALRRAKGEFVLLINPDTVWRKGTLGKAIRFMKDSPEAGALGARLVLGDGTRQKSYGNFPTLLRELKETFYLPRVFPGSRWMRGVFAYEVCLNPKPVDWISCTFFLCRRALMAEVGYFREEYFMYYEDIDLSKRIGEKGKEIYYYPEIEVVHHQQDPSMIDFGESPYIYFYQCFGLTFAKMLRYVLVLKTFLRVMIFAPIALFSGKAVYKGKFRSNYGTFKFHLFRASRVIRDLRIAK